MLSQRRTLLEDPEEEESRVEVYIYYVLWIEELGIHIVNQIK